MMDYQGFWLGFLLLFALLPGLVGAVAGLLWARRRGRRGAQQVAPACLGAAICGLSALAGAVLFFGA